MAKHQNHESDEAQNTVISKYVDEAMEGQKLSQGTTKVTNDIKVPRSSDFMFVEILMEIMEVTNIPVTHKGSLVLCISKKQPGIMFGQNRRINICTEAEETQVVVLQCEPKGELLFELSSNSNLDVVAENTSTSFGKASISLADLLKSVSKLTILRRLEFGSGIEPVMLSLAISTTPPSPAPYYALSMVDTSTMVSTSSGKCSAKCNPKCYDGGTGCSAKCQGGLRFSMCAASSGRCLASCHGGGSCSAKCHGGADGVGLFSMFANKISASSSGSCSAKCQGGGNGGGDCSAKCHV